MNCPAEVRLVAEITDAVSAEYPIFTVFIPKPKETDRYPSEIGIPCAMPLVKSCFNPVIPFLMKILLPVSGGEADV
jgi:hypothetical protein